MVNSREQAAREWVEKKVRETELPDPEDIFLAGCEHEAKRDKWVSVKERLPEELLTVLTYGSKENDDGAAMYYNKGSWYMEAPYDSEPMRCYEPLFWQHIILPPNPPKEVSE